MGSSIEVERLDGAIVVALGSNLRGNWPSSEALLEAAIAGLPGRLMARSSWWRSAAWPNPTDPEYVNGVALVEAALAPLEVLSRLLDLERRFRRDRRAANAPRTLDLDLVAYGRLTEAGPGLVLPHPRSAERAFVMRPLAEIAPKWRHPVSGRSAAELAATATVGVDASRLVAPRPP